jgi:iron(III) transport system ATP-binding protein
MGAFLKVEHLTQHYAEKKTQKRILDDLSFELAEGEIACLLGSSGCGKTTALRAIAGFESLTAGRIELGGRCLSHQTPQATRPLCNVPTHQRRIGMVFQDYALFPHLTVAKNVGFGLQELSAGDKAQRVQKMLDLVSLSALAERYPHELSGGQQQRVALARALAPRPQLLLLDEPFSNLDVVLRESLAQEVRAILKHEGTTALMVTHDQQEAFALADNVGVMHQGQIEQWGKPHELYQRPSSAYIADFIGAGVLVAATALGAGFYRLDLGALGEVRDIGGVAANLDAASHAANLAEGRVLIRPEQIVLDDNSPIKVTLQSLVFKGSHQLATLLSTNGTVLLAQLPSHFSAPVGLSLGIHLRLDAVAFFANTQS